MKVAIRVDSSTAIGSGHLMRCLTLAARMRKEKNAEVHFISRDLEGNLHGKVKDAGFPLHILPCHPIDKSLDGYDAWLTVPQAVDAAETKAVLRALGKVDRLVVDNYALDINWEQEMRPFVDEVFVIDDLANRKHDCDILLDQSFYVNMDTRYTSLVPANCKLFLGPAYALLREEFYREKVRLRKRRGIVQNLLIFYGGSDLTNETMKAVRAVVCTGATNITVNVIVGASNPHKEEIITFCRSYSFLNVHVQVNNMAEFMNEADLALGAGGSTIWERCFFELPSIVTSVADNQRPICENAAVMKYIDYMGIYSEVRELDLQQRVKKYLTEGISEKDWNFRIEWRFGLS